MNDQTIQLKDALTSEEALVIIRKAGESIGICLSVEANGDTEVFFSSTDFSRLISMLQEFERELHSG